MKDGETISEVPSTHQQVAALPYRVGAVIEFMIVSSRETRRWVIPKGGAMKGKSLPASAAVEALEEAGLEGVISEGAIGLYHYVKRLKNGANQHYAVSVYPLHVIKQRKNWLEKSQRVTRWVSVEEAASAVHEPELQELILAFGASLRAQAEVHDRASSFS